MKLGNNEEKLGVCSEMIGELWENEADGQISILPARQFESYVPHIDLLINYYTTDIYRFISDFSRAIY